MISNFKNQNPSKSNKANICIENSSKENKPINSRSKPLQQFLYANRSLFYKISSNIKPSLLSPNPACLKKTINVKPTLKENTSDKCKGSTDILNNKKKSIETKSITLKSKTKNGKSQIEIGQFEEFLWSKNIKQSDDKCLQRPSSKIKNPIVPPSTVASKNPQHSSMSYFYNTVYCNSNQCIKRPTLSKDPKKANEPMAQTFQLMGYHQNNENYQSQNINHQFSQTGGLSFKNKIQLNLQKSGKTPSQTKSPDAMQMETNEDKYQPNSAEYVRIPNYCLVYVSKIVSYLFEKECKQIKPSPGFCSIEFNDSIRVTLYDSLVNIAKVLKLRDRTLFLTLEIIEIYLSSNFLMKQEFKLMSIAVLFLVSKYEEIYPPKLSCFLKAINEMSLKEDMLSYESRVIEFFNFDVSRVISLDFFVIFANVAEFDQTTINFGLFVMCLCSMEQSFYACSHSLIAFGICYFLQKLFKMNPFYEIIYEEGNAIYTLNINRGRFDTSQLGNNCTLKNHENFKINFRHKDVKSVSEGIYTITQKLKPTDCPFIFQKFQNENVQINKKNTKN